MIYLDYAATTPIQPKALAVYAQVAEQYYGNASSLHDVGSAARQIKEASAKTIAGLIGAEAKNIHFCSGASEGNFLAIRALLDGYDGKGKHIITTQIEHSSVRDVFLKLESEGYKVSWLGVDENGRADVEELKKSISDSTVLVSVQQVNSEIGTVQPIAEMGEFLRQKGVLFHCDAVQSFGKLAVNVNNLNVDALTISGHKIYGPKGVGAVWLHPGVNWKPLLGENPSPKKLKSGTENIPAIAGFATAAKYVLAELEAELRRITELRSAFISQLNKRSYKCVIEGDAAHQSPYILGVRFPGMEGQFLMLECNQAGVAISTGSACQLANDKPNRTMKALGRTDEEARQFVRFSFGKDVKADQLDEIIAKIDTILKRHFDKVTWPST